MVSQTIKGGLIECIETGKICPINRTCEYFCKSSCLDASELPIYGVSFYSADSSLCKAALHDLRVSKWNPSLRFIKIVSFLQDDCFFQSSVRFGVTSQNLHKNSCHAFKFQSPRVPGEENENATLLRNYIQHTKIWENEPYGLGFQCVPTYTTLSIVTSIAFSQDAYFLPKTLTVVANAHDNVVLSMTQQANTSSGIETLWMKDGNMVLPVVYGLELPLKDLNESHSGIYSLKSRNFSVVSQPSFIQLIVRGCPKERYSVNCSLHCPKCLNGGVCHDITGECVCAPGFNGSRCEKACEPGYVGKMCNIACPGKSNDSSTLCQGLLICLPSPYGCSCASGFKGIFCDEVCKDGYYGAGCLQKRKYLHYQMDSCSRTSGSCGCLNGWQGMLCDVSYPVLNQPPTIMNVSKNSLILSFLEWSEEKDIGLGTPSSYEVIFREFGYSGWQHAEKISAEVINQSHAVTVQSLKPGVLYEVGVVVIDTSGNKQEADVRLLNVTTLCDAPSSPPTDIELDVLNQNVSVSWKLPPKVFWNCQALETFIHLRESSSNHTEEYRVNETFFSFYSELFLTWMVQVCVSSDDQNPNDLVCSVPENITIDGIMYSEPIDLEVIKHESSIEISWIPPTKFSGKMSHYIMSFEDQTNNVTEYGILLVKDAACQNDHIFSHCYMKNDIVPGHLYEIQIIAVVGGLGEYVIQRFTVELDDVDSVSPSSVSIFLIILPLLLAVVIVFVFFLYKKKQMVSSLKIKFFPSYKVEEDFAACNEALDEMDIIETESLCDEVSSKVHLRDLPDYVRENVQNNKIRKEFLSVPNGQIYPCSVAKKEENKPKNRYGNILPYDHSRVILDAIKDDLSSSYIHASYVNGYKKVKKYIATQGPLGNTINDFWRMVWEESACKILMITNFVENGKAKCEKYWPDSSADHGDFTVTFVESNSYANFVIRTLEVAKGNTSRVVKHFHYTSWPDHGAPSNTPPFVSFLKKARAYKPEDQAPIIVHCSAGIGRTGATILLDSMVDMGLHEKSVDLVKHLFAMRKERMNILENLDQYVFVHYALIEYLCFEETCMASSEFKAEFERLQQIDSATGLTGIEKMYQDLNGKHFQLIYKDVQGAYLLENQSKNRSMHILPPDKARPYLPRGSSESAYINAVYVDSFSVKKAFIATQYPLLETVEDFWNMIYETKSSIVVFLQDTEFPDAENCPKLWCLGQKTVGSFRIEQCSTTTNDNLTVTNLYLFDQKKETDSPLTVVAFSLSNWAYNERLPTNLQSFLSLIPPVFLQNESERVITSVCWDGVTACGIFCAILFMCDQIQREQTVDVMHAVKCIKANRPQFILDLDQFKALFELVDLAIHSGYLS